jgi:Fe-S-cluster containining protein
MASLGCDSGEIKMDQPIASSLETAHRSAVTNTAALEQLEKQVERGHLFEHTALGESFTRLGDVETFLHALLDLLLMKGIVNDDELRGATAGVRQELIDRGQLSGPGTAIGVEKSEDGPPSPAVHVDCDKRMHICHAICCKLHFALTIPEIESGKIKWDLGRPYFIRHQESGFCTHNDRQTGGCGIYTDRPATCKTYSCANDERIWKNFELMELNEEWIESHLSANAKPGISGRLMQAEALVQIQPRAGRLPSTPPPATVA